MSVPPVMIQPLPTTFNVAKYHIQKGPIAHQGELRLGKKAVSNAIAWTVCCVTDIVVDPTNPGYCLKLEFHDGTASFTWRNVSLLPSFNNDIVLFEQDQPQIGAIVHCFFQLTHIDQCSTPILNFCSLIVLHTAQEVAQDNTLLENGVGYRGLVEQHFHTCVEYYYQNCFHPMLDTIPLLNTPYHPLPMRWEFFNNKLLVDGRSIVEVEEEMANISCDCDRCSGKAGPEFGETGDNHGAQPQQDEKEKQCTCQQNNNDNKINTNNSSLDNDNAKLNTQQLDTTNDQDAQAICGVGKEDTSLSDDDNNNNNIVLSEDPNNTPSPGTTSTNDQIATPTTEHDYTSKCAVCIDKEQHKQQRQQCKRELPFYSPDYPRDPTLPPTPRRVFYYGVDVTNRLMAVVGAVGTVYEDYSFCFSDGRTTADAQDIPARQTTPGLFSPAPPQVGMMISMLSRITASTAKRFIKRNSAYHNTTNNNNNNSSPLYRRASAHHTPTLITHLTPDEAIPLMESHITTALSFDTTTKTLFHTGQHLLQVNSHGAVSSPIPPTEYPPFPEPVHYGTQQVIAEIIAAHHGRIEMLLEQNVMMYEKVSEKDASSSRPVQGKNTQVQVKDKDEEIKKLRARLAQAEAEKAELKKKLATGLGGQKGNKHTHRK